MGLRDGILPLLAANKDLAPWFSGTATLLGVGAALHNAQKAINQTAERQRKEDDRRREEKEDREMAMASSASGILHMASLNVSIVGARCHEVGSKVFLAGGAIENSMNIASRMLQTFPVHEIRNGEAVKHWYKAEIFHSHLRRDIGEGQRALEAGAKNDVINAIIESVKSNCNAFEKSRSLFARAVGVEELSWVLASKVGQEA